MSNDTLVVVLYGGPGTGKSTTAALTFGALKQKGYNVEMSHEYAKDLVWEKAFGKLEFQPLVTAKQMWRLRRLQEQVEVIITDTSTLLALIYGTEEGGVTDAFRDWIVDDYRRLKALNIFLRRNPQRPYNPKGRNQTEEEARAADNQIENLLLDIGEPYTPVVVDAEGSDHVAGIVWEIEKKIANRRENAETS